MNLETIEETVLRGTGRLWCENEKKVANIDWLNNVTWDAICEYCGKVGEGSLDDKHYINPKD